MIDFNEFLDVLKTDLKETALEFGEEYVSDIVSAGSEFAQKMKESLIRRTNLLASGDLTEEEYLWLLKSDKDLLEMKALELKGLSIVKLNNIQDAILGVVVGSIKKVI